MANAAMESSKKPPTNDEEEEVVSAPTSVIHVGAPPPPPPPLTEEIQMMGQIQPSATLLRVTMSPIERTHENFECRPRFEP